MAQSAEPGFAPPWRMPNRRVLLWLTVAALVTRLVWVLWVHPPGNYVFSDMKKYVERAQLLASEGELRDRTLAWQVWGTHYVYGVVFAIFGKTNYVAAAVMNGLMSAFSVPLAYALACRVSRVKWVPEAVGVGCLIWHPNLSLSGYFLSETPFLFFQLWSTYWLVRLMQEGKRAVGAGLVSAVAFAIRPQSALFFLLTFLTYLLCRRRLAHVRPTQVLAVALPLVLTLSYSVWRFHHHTGYWGGIAENANMNFTAGRCHNIVTQAFKDGRELRRSDRRGSTRDGRRVSLPGFRLLRAIFPEQHPLALRPALEHESIKFVGYVGDPNIHRAIRARCYERTGFIEQARYSVVNASLLWFFGKQWPEMEKNGRWFYPYIEAYRRIYQWVLWLPSLMGIFLMLGRIRRSPEAMLPAWHLVTSIVIASIFFGTIRLRTPYDPYAIMLAFEVYALVGLWAWRRWKARAVAGGGNPPRPPRDGAAADPG